MKLGVILLAGGIGSRMGGTLPKQYLLLEEQPLVQHSYRAFATCGAAELVVVCAPEYQSYFPAHPLFALPGTRRQDSVWNGLQQLGDSIDYVCIHDAARPLVTSPLIQQVIAAAIDTGAATLAVPLKFTVKRGTSASMVEETPDRASLWEIQTPQCIKKSWLEEGFAYAAAHNGTATDDAALIEPLGYPVKLVQGCYSNIKVTTPEDLILAEHLWKRRTIPTS